MIRKQLSNNALWSIRLNSFKSYCKFILKVAGDINLNSTPVTSKAKNNVRDDFPVCYYYLCIDWTENCTSFDFDILNSGNKLSMFKNKKMHFIHSNE